MWTASWWKYIVFYYNSQAVKHHNNCVYIVLYLPLLGFLFLFVLLHTKYILHDLCKSVHNVVLRRTFPSSDFYTILGCKSLSLIHLHQFDSTMTHFYSDSIWVDLIWSHKALNVCLIQFLISNLIWDKLMDFPWLFLKFNIQFIRNQFFAGANLLREHFDVMNINRSLCLSLSLSLSLGFGFVDEK